MINYDDINNFIYKVFNYYNGRINVINRAILDINWANLNSLNVGGYSRLPNIVTINAGVICRFFRYNEYDIKVSIIETVIHELYHTDQLINYQVYMADINYNRFIESACQIQTAIYIVGHIQEIYYNFGINLINSAQLDFYRCDIRSSTAQYERRRYYEHIFMCIDDLINLNNADANTKKVGCEVYNYIKNNIENGHDINLSINNETIYIIHNKKIIDINEFNRFIFKFVCDAIRNVKYEISFYKKSNALEIDVTTSVSNIMCKLV